MSLLAEELVEEWLRRDGYFTIRGLKSGNSEIDLLAVKPTDNSTLRCRQVEGPASFRPIGYICPLTKERQRFTGCPVITVRLGPSPDIPCRESERALNEVIHPILEGDYLVR